MQKLNENNMPFFMDIVTVIVQHVRISLLMAFPPINPFINI
jgi:hypothetical protein